MSEKNPLSIKYINEEGGASFGWSAREPESVNPHNIPVFGPGSETALEARGEKFVDAVHNQVLLFFNGPLSADLNIPENYPYEFYEPEKDVPTYIGRLRETEDLQ